MTNVSTNTLDGWDVVYEVTEAVAQETGLDIGELPTLYGTIDPDALAAFLRCSNGPDARSERSVEFSYCEYRVTVHSSGRVNLHPESEPPTPQAPP